MVLSSLSLIQSVNNFKMVQNIIKLLYSLNYFYYLNLLKIILLFVKFIQIQMNSSDDENILSHTKKLGNNQFEVYCKSHPQTSHLIFSIQKYLSNYPSFYYNSLLMINKGRSLQSIEKKLKTQFDQLISEKSFYHLITKALISRQKCIQKIKRDLTKANRILTIFKKQYLKPNSIHHMAYLEYVEQQGYSNVQVDQTIQNSIKLISQIFVDMSRLRDMTLYVVQTIHQWKYSIQEWLDKCNQYEQIFFQHNQRNAYEIILDDINFIWDSPLSEYIFLQIKNDPFLVRNVLQVEQREQKTILQKYFVEILYPKSQQIVTRSVKCYEMLTFKYQPQINNLYRQEQLLIQNYLSLQKKQQNEETIQQISQKQFQWEDKTKKQKINRLHSKGWVFGNNLKKPHTQRIKQIIERHQQKITFIKPFNITNYSEKNSIALAYISEAKAINSQNQYVKQKKPLTKIYNSNSMRQLNRPTTQSKKILQNLNKKGYRSQSQEQKTNNNKLSRMYQSLSKLTPIIFQDPKEYQQTPKNQDNRKKKLFQNNYLSHSETETIVNKQIKKISTIKNIQNIQIDNKNQDLQILALKTKFNTFKQPFEENNQNQKLNQKQQRLQQQNNSQNQVNADKKLKISLPEQKKKSLDSILIEQEQKSLNFGDFLTNFRAPTTAKIKKNDKDIIINSQRKLKIQENESKLVTIKQLIEQNKLRGFKTIRSRSLLSDKSRKSHIFNVKTKFPFGIKDTKQNNTKNQFNKSDEQNQFKDYRLKLDRSQPKAAFKFHDEFIILTSKSIPIDIAAQYLRHVFAQVHSTGKKFTLYSYDQILKKLEDPYIHCIIFDISTQKKGNIGQVILSESIGVNNQKLKYTIQFINIHPFQMIVATILRIAEQILYATPCEQVICPFIQDKLDPVSVHFIDLIENALKIKVDSFGMLTILQRKRLYYKDSDLHQRLYVFSTKNKKQYETKIAKNMMGNYRSLRFESKCLLLASNFRMRSKTIAKNVISNYDSTSLGFMYRKILDKILTKFHLRQIKTASISSNDSDETVNLIKQNSFLRTSISTLTQYLKEQKINENDYIHLTRFQNMSQVLTYLDYKHYSQYFHFNFLEESRFILNHQLFICEIDIQLSIQLMVRASVDFLMLYNYHNLTLKTLQPNSRTKAKSIILPTTNQDIDLIFIDGKQYELQTTDKLDLFSYLYIYQQQLKNYKQIHNIKQIVIPTIQNNSKNLNSVRMFDGLFRLFPEREFYSGTFFKCTNLWESYFPTAVIYKPTQQSYVFQYPLIVGFLHKQRNQIISAFVLRDGSLS